MSETTQDKDPLFGNKLAAALLCVLLLAVGLPVVVRTFAELSKHVSAHHEEAPYPGGLVYAPFDIDSIGEAAAADDGPAFDLGTTFLTASVEQGARAAAICSSCHSFDRGGPHGTGPNLWEVVGRPIASVSGYAYSGALQSFGAGKEWGYEELNHYLENSQGYVPGTQMAQKIRKDDKRVDILAYLGSLSDSPAPYPEPVVQEAPAEGEAAGGEGEITDEAVTEEMVGGETPDGSTAEAEAAEAAADTIDFEAAQPGEAVISDSKDVNDRGDDGYPGDVAKEGSPYRSSDDDGDVSEDVPDQADADRLGADLDPSSTVPSGLPNTDAARESAQPEARR